MENLINLRNFNAAQRRNAASKGQAVKDNKASGGGSYPIKTIEDLNNAKKLFAANKGKYDEAKRKKIAAHIAKHEKRLKGSVNMSTSINLVKQQNGKEGAASDGNRSPDKLKKTIAAYKKKKGKMSSSQRKKVEARIKSSQQQLGQKVGLSEEPSDSIQLANTTGSLTKRPSVLGHQGKTASQPRAYGGKFGVKAGSGPKGSTNTTSGTQTTDVVEPITPAQIAASVNKLTVGQSITLPGGNAKIKRLSNGYQVVKMDGSFNKTFISVGPTVLAANRLVGGRRGKDTKIKKQPSSSVSKGGAA